MTQLIRQPRDLSIIVPIYNEEENIRPVYSKIKDALVALKKSYEIIYIDDGSTDKSFDELKEVQKHDPHVKIIHFLTNYGQTPALAAGIEEAQGDVIIMMDGDGQNDPADFSRLLAELDKGFDVVSGWRKDRQDGKLLRLIPSYFANKLISKISRVNLHDYGCTLKAYRKNVIKGIKLYGEMHRFIPIYTSLRGGKLSEIEVNHHPRIAGYSKYGIFRVYKVLLDLLLVRFFQKYYLKPIHFFGKIGFLSIFAGFGTAAWAFWLKYANGVSFVTTPLPLITVFLILTGILSVMMGILAELVMRTYFESQNKPIYEIAQIIS